MNWTLEVQDPFPPRNIENTDTSLPLILNLLQLSQSEINLAYDFNQAFEICQFQLGDQFRDYHASASSENSVHTEQDDDWFYLVCQGRVRLLGYDATGKRNVSAVVVEVGETFGLETLWANAPELRYAIAASSGCVARILVIELERWLQRLPQLRDYLQQQAMERQCLIFFKTSTDLRGLTTHQLKQG